MVAGYLNVESNPVFFILTHADLKISKYVCLFLHYSSCSLRILTVFLSLLLSSLCLQHSLLKKLNMYTGYCVKFSFALHSSLSLCISLSLSSLISTNFLLKEEGVLKPTLSSFLHFFTFALFSLFVCLSLFSLSCPALLPTLLLILSLSLSLSFCLYI